MWSAEKLVRAGVARRPTRRGMQFRIFNDDIRPRLRDGQIIGCSSCRIVTPKNLWATFCDACLEKYQQERKREAAIPEWQRGFCFADPFAAVREAESAR
jgi:hypothetical protein